MRSRSLGVFTTTGLTKLPPAADNQPGHHYRLAAKMAPALTHHTKSYIYFDHELWQVLEIAPINLVPVRGLSLT